MRPRIERELALLRQYYDGAEYAELVGDEWFLLPGYSLPPGWRVHNEPVERVPVAFFVTAGHPGTIPYGFLAPAGLNFDGTVPNNTGAPPKVPPFPGEWLHFSW